MKRAGAPTIIAVDLLRFGCAMLVLAYHYGVAFWRSPDLHDWTILAGRTDMFSGTPFSHVGWIGVELFFVISGLVIARSAVDIRWTGFLRKRALRLLPMAWVCATITLAALAATAKFSGSELLDEWSRSIRFWPIGAQIDGSYWTLGIEASFYLLVALTIGTGAGTDRIERLAVGLAAMSGGFWAWFLWAGPVATPVPDNRIVMLMLLPHGCFFAIGMLIAAMADGRTMVRRMAILMPCLVIALVEIWAHTAERAAAVGESAPLLLAGAIFLGGVAILLGAGRLQSPLAHWIPQEAARTIGLMTYPLYLLHQDVGAILLVALADLGLSVRIASGLSAAAILGLAWIAVRLLEPGIRAALSGALSARRGPARDTLPSASPPAG